jgi:hypothetical protein
MELDEFNPRNNNIVNHLSDGGIMYISEESEIAEQIIQLSEILTSDPNRVIPVFMTDIKRRLYVDAILQKVAMVCKFDFVSVSEELFMYNNHKFMYVTPTTFSDFMNESTEQYIVMSELSREVAFE